jgi:hypothetical protein
MGVCGSLLPGQRRWDIDIPHAHFAFSIRHLSQAWQILIGATAFKSPVEVSFRAREGDVSLSTSIMKSSVTVEVIKRDQRRDQWCSLQERVSGPSEVQSGASSVLPGQQQSTHVRVPTLSK